LARTGVWVASASADPIIACTPSSTTLPNVTCSMVDVLLPQ
jgi:hypothetical protein